MVRYRRRPRGILLPHTMPSDLWPAVKDLLRSRLAAEEFEVWLAPLTARAGSGRLTVVAPPRVYADYVRDHYLALLQEFAEQAAGTAAVSYTHLRAHETVLDLVCRLLLAKKNKKT